jgi:HEAT repeat protein
MVRIEIAPRFRKPDVVKEALAGRIEQLPPSVAIAMVQDLDINESEQRRILHEALEDRGLETRVRAQAVSALASLGAESAVEELVGVLDQPDLEAEVASRAVTILGRMAGREQLDRLEAVKEAAATEVLRERAAFAQALIVHRLGLTVHRVDLPIAERLRTPESAGVYQQGDRLSQAVRRDRTRSA